MTRVVSQDTSRRLRWLRSRLAYMALIAFMAFFAYSFLQKTKEIKGLAQQESALRSANAQLSAENARVAGNIRYDRTLGYVEARARSDLGWTKPGEYIIQSNPHWQHVAVTRAAPKPVALPPKPVWQRWLDSFAQG